ncbi:AAA family ATPase [Cohnella faecalis]|uniref:YhaN AAA domain-containing protein n=1 Tax=Cohnella faecalis TaxID=2315694 RepID=A0A398CFG6_9BACL|nr:AAA family ATPase [Cohnella faecalis]RIE00642.1 hypothetical protein D3H35_27135 [Cohnella faecalis]
MQIRELQVDGYGALHGISCAFDAPVTVLYGPNEAGKSTLLRFIRSMLYGFPTRKEPVERGEPVGGGRHGGRLLLLSSSGRELTLERHSDGSTGNGGRKNGTSGFAIRDGSGVFLPISQSEWERSELGGVSERLYRQLFSVSLDELHELRTLQGEEVGNYLYHAGVMGGRALTEARRTLAAEMDKLFKPKGTTPEMNKLLALIKETESSIRQRRNDVHYYNETVDALTETESRLTLADRSLPELKAQAADSGRALELREWWLKGLAAEREEAECAAQLSDPLADPLPEDAAVVWAVLVNEREAATDRLEQAKRVLDEKARARARLSWDEGMVDAAAELERLDSLRETTVSRREELASLLVEARAANEQIDDWLARISPHWTEKELQVFSGTTAEREQARRMQQAWGEADRALERLDAEARRLERQKEAWLIQRRDDFLDSEVTARSMSELGSENRSSVIFKPADKASLLQEWLGLEEQLRLLERARATAHAQQASALQASRRSVRGRNDNRAAGGGLLLALSGVTAAAAFIVLAVNGLTPISYGIAGVLLFAAVATASATALMRRREARAVRTGSRQGVDSAQTESNQAVQAQMQLVSDRIRRLVANADSGAAVFSAGGKDYELSVRNLDDAGWSVFREIAYARMDELEREERANEKERERVRRLGEFDREAEAIHRELGRMDAERDRLHMQWREWLEQRKLPAELVPEGMPELFGLAEQAQTLQRRKERLQERAEQLRAAIADFERAAGSLLEQFPAPARSPATLP